MEPDPDAPLPRWLRLVPVCAGVVVIALAVALVVLRNDEDTRPRAQVGDVYASTTAEKELAHRGEVLLPWARLQVGASRPRTELPDLLGSESNIQAPDSGSFVRVDASLEKDFQIPLASVHTPYTQETEIVLRADGEDYAVNGPGGLAVDPNGPPGQGGSVWVAVDGQPTDVEVRVTVDGETQVVDASDGSVDHGRAAAFDSTPAAEDLRKTEPVACGEPRRIGDRDLRVPAYAKPTCAVQLTLRTPYVDGLGWTAADHDYLLVHLIRSRDVEVSTGSGSDLEFWRTGLAVTARLGDRASRHGPIDVNSLSQGGLSLQDPADPDQFVFEVPQDGPLDDLVVELAVRATPRDPFSDVTRTLRFRWAVPGGELT